MHPAVRYNTCQSDRDLFKEEKKRKLLSNEGADNASMAAAQRPARKERTMAQLHLGVFVRKLEKL